MEVSQVTDHITHAVIGGQQVINFSMSNDAALMDVLSKSLYTDPILAVIRETMCNGWDAHIEAGCTDKALMVTVSGNELVIRDFGLGIPKSMIGAVYGTYGGSTKKKNVMVTGGFGLGCKSPFAITDNFEVTSWSHEDGTMTVYSISKSNAEVDGKPGIIPIVSVPTTEQGLQVRVKLSNLRETRRVLELVHRIARNGEMKVICNRVEIEVLPFKDMKSNFIITDQNIIETSQPILLRYGHVIYPVERHQAFAKEFDRILKILGKIPSKTGRYSSNDMKIIFQAAPNTISITPSREALSMQESTVTTITQLVTDFLVEAEARLKDGCFEVLKTAHDTVWLTGSPKELFDTGDRIPNLATRFAIETEAVITNFDQFIVRYASYTYPDYTGFKLKDQIGRVEALIKAGFGDAKMLNSFKRHLEDPAMDVPEITPWDEKKNPELTKYSKAKRWFLKNVIDPVASGIVTNPEMRVEALFVYARATNTRGYGEELKVNPIHSIPEKPLWGYFPFLRRIVVLTHNRIDFAERAKHFPVMKFWLGNVENCLMYTVARSPAKVAVALAYFESIGYTVIDLTKAQKWESQDVIEPIKEYVSTAPRRKGIPKLKSCLGLDKNNEPVINLTLPKNQLDDLVVNPEFVMKYNPKSTEPYFEDQSILTSKFIINQWGDIGAFVVNENQKTKYLEAGAVEYQDFVLDKILEQFKTNVRIRETLPYMFGRDDKIMGRGWTNPGYPAMVSFLEAIYADSDLCQYFDIIQTMTDEDKIYMKMWDEFKKNGYQGTKGHYKQIKEIMETFPLDQLVYDLFNKMKKSTLLNALNSDWVRDTLKDKNMVNPQQRTIVRDMLLQAIEG